MLHQDLRPQNVMIDRTGTAKIIDFGSTRVAGISEMASPLSQGEMLGTVQYMAPEYYLGEGGDERSDLYSLGVIAYQLLSGRLPYGADVARARTRAAQRQLHYQSVLADDREIPAWIDAVLRKAVHPDPGRVTPSCPNSCTTCDIPTRVISAARARRCWSATRWHSGADWR
jgi:serine/threonine protein kinase